MMAFGEYAKYYDLLYADKDYAAESAFVGEVIHRHAPGARSSWTSGLRADSKPDS